MKKSCVVFSVIVLILSATCCWADLPSDLANALGVPPSNVLIKSATANNSTIINHHLVDIENNYSSKYDDTYYIELRMAYFLSRPLTVPVQIHWKPASFHQSQVRAYIMVDGIMQQPVLSGFISSLSNNINMLFDVLEIMWIGNVALVVELFNGSTLTGSHTFSLPQSGLTISL